MVIVYITILYSLIIIVYVYKLALLQNQLLELRNERDALKEELTVERNATKDAKVCIHIDIEL